MNALMRFFCLLWLIAAIWLTAPEVHGQNTSFKFLEVTVVDPDGKPMADVPVEISIDQIKIPLMTDAEGIVSTNIPTGKNCEVEVRIRHEGFTAMGVGWRGSKVPEQVTIPLAKGVTFGGIVHDEQGQPVEGVEVSGQMVWNNRHGLVKDGEVAPYLDGELAKTDKEGRWQCSMGPEGDAEFQLNFSHPDFLDLNPDESVTWEELKSRKKIAVLDKGVTLTGRILTPDGKVLSKGHIEITKLENGGTISWHEVADVEGNFRFARVPKGPATLSVQTSMYAPLKLPIEVKSDMAPLDVQLERGRPIRLKLVNAAGEALPDGRVEIVDWRFYRDNLHLGKKAEADEQGIWRWDLSPSGDWTYQVSAPGYRTAKHKLIPSDELQTITLKPAVKVTGRVIDKATREPIKKFSLLGIAAMETDQQELYLELFGDIVLDTSGDYAFQSGILCESFHISCSANGYKNSSSRLIKPDEDEVAWNFELERDPEAKP
jgi:hypothetical protein